MPGAHRVTVLPSQVAAGIDFGNRREFGSIEGFKFYDEDGDGQRDHGETGMSGVVIYSDQNGNGVRELGEAFVTTQGDDPTTPEDETGTFVLTGLEAGLYIVAEEAPRGFTQSFPAHGQPYHVELAAGQIVDSVLFGNKEGINFGNAPFGSVHGLKYEDLNGNGILDPGEAGLPGVTVFLDFNGNNRLDEDDLATVTMSDDPATAEDETGQFWIEAVPPGSYTLLEVLEDGWFSTFPGPDGQAVVVAPGETVEGLLIGNARFASIHGFKWNDTDGDGTRDPEEPGVADIVIYADLNRNGQLDPEEPSTRTMQDDPATSEDETGRYWLENLRPGEYLIQEVLPPHVVQIFPGGSLQGYEVTLTSGQEQLGIDFANAHTCDVHGWKWQDNDQDGRIDADEPGVAGVVIYADLNRNGQLDPHEPFTQSLSDDPTTPRDETGKFRLAGLIPGEYLIREVLPEGTINVFPGEGQGHLIVLTNCGDIFAQPTQLAAALPVASDPGSPAGEAIRTVESIQLDDLQLVAQIGTPPFQATALPTTTNRSTYSTQRRRRPTTRPRRIPGPVEETAASQPMKMDVDADGIVSESDTRQIITHLNSRVVRHLRWSADPGVSPNDVNGDRFVSPIDLLIVINYLTLRVDSISSVVDVASFVTSRDVHKAHEVATWDAESPARPQRLFEPYRGETARTLDTAPAHERVFQNPNEVDDLLYGEFWDELSAEAEQQTNDAKDDRDEQVTTGQGTHSGGPRLR